MNTNLRIGHFSPDAPAVNVVANGDTLLENVGFGTLGDYMEIDAGSYEIEIVPASGGDAVLSATLELDDDTDYAVLAIGMLSEIQPLVLTDDRPAIGDDESRVRFVHTAPDAPAVDILADGATLFENVEFGASGDFATVDSGSHDIEVRPHGSDESVLSRPGIGFDGATAYTVLATGTLADETLDAMIVSDYVWADDRMPAAR
jgi:hypothetical protein